MMRSRYAATERKKNVTGGIPEYCVTRRSVARRAVIASRNGYRQEIFSLQERQRPCRKKKLRIGTKSKARRVTLHVGHCDRPRGISPFATRCRSTDPKLPKENPTSAAMKTRRGCGRGIERIVAVSSLYFIFLCPAGGFKECGAEMSRGEHDMSRRDGEVTSFFHDHIQCIDGIVTILPYFIFFPFPHLFSFVVQLGTVTGDRYIKEKKIGFLFSSLYNCTFVLCRGIRPATADMHTPFS